MNSSTAHAGAQSAVTQALSAFIDDYVTRYPDLRDPFDPQWRSPCEIGPPLLAPGQAVAEQVHSQHAQSQMEIPWRPLARELPTDLFAPLARALEIDIHPDIIAYYGSFFSGGLEAHSAEGPVSLLQLWNHADAERLIENLLGHAIAKQRAKAPYSIFFACTEVDSDLFLSVENHTGHVILERPGYPPERTVTGCLADFIRTLTPAPPQRHPERAASTSAL